jgi:hypothetical protein
MIHPLKFSEQQYRIVPFLSCMLNKVTNDLIALTKTNDHTAMGLPIVSFAVFL